MKQLLLQPQRKFNVYKFISMLTLDNNSIRLFNKATPSNRAIATFSARHKSHFRELHL